MGLFLGKVPQCGDLTMSGHTIYLWVLALFFMETVSKVLKGFVLVLLKLVVVVLLLVVLLTIVLIRNHYTIDVVLATVFTNAFWLLYIGFDHLSRMSNKEFVQSIIGRIFRSIEEVPIELECVVPEDDTHSVL
jgi:membrane-associated phospholipid phosphatase